MNGHIMDVKYARALSLFGTIILFFIGTKFIGVDYGSLINEFWVFISVDPYSVSNGYTNMMNLIRDICGIVVIDVVLAIVIGLTITAIIGKANSSIEELLNLGNGRHAAMLFGLVCLEEIFARWLFLGILAPLFNSNFAFYFFLIAGNLIWSLIHLTNYKKEKDKSVWRVAPQFIGGFFLSFIFVKYGLFACIITHFTYNAVVFAIAKKRDVKVRDLALAAYSILILAFSYIVMQSMSLEVSNLMPWLTENTIKPIANFGFWEYFIVFLFLSSLFDAATDCLLFDYTKTDEVFEDKPGLLIVTMGLAALVYVALIFGLNLFLGFFIDNIVVRAFLIIIGIMLINKYDSISAMSKKWFNSIVPGFLFVCIAIAAGYWVAVGVLALNAVIELVPYQLRLE